MGPVALAGDRRVGITWILDGLEVTMVGNIAGVLTEPDSGLSLT